MKQREHTTVGDIDHYTDIDSFIPEALRIAKAKYPDDRTIRDVFFHETMDRLTSQAGLRLVGCKHEFKQHEVQKCVNCGRIKELAS